MKKYTLGLLFSCSLLLPVLTFAQSAVQRHSGPLVNPDPTKPPPYLDVPGDPRPVDRGDPATAAIDPAVRSRVDSAGRGWAQGVGHEFSPGLAYLHGVPTLMLMARATEPADVHARRLGAIVSACEFMLDSTAFGQAVICIATFDPKAKQVMSTQNVTITRDAFQNAAKKHGNSPVFGAALAAVHKDPASVQQLCSELGFN